MPDNKILIMIGGMAFLLPAAPFLALAGIGLIVVGCIIYSVIKSFDEYSIRREGFVNLIRTVVKRFTLCYHRNRKSATDRRLPFKLTVKNNR